jgi:hypothetical protein
MTGPAWQEKPPARGNGGPYATGQAAPPSYGSGPPPGQSSGLGPDAPERKTAPVEPGLFGTLFDFTFDKFVTVRLVKLLYTLAVICISGVGLVLFLMGWSLAAGSFWPLMGWAMVIGVPIMWLGAVVLVRVVVEYLVVDTKTSQDVAIIRDAVKELRDGGRP